LHFVGGENSGCSSANFANYECEVRTVLITNSGCNGAGLESGNCVFFIAHGKEVSLTTKATKDWAIWDLRFGMWDLDVECEKRQDFITSYLTSHFTHLSFFVVIAVLVF
jgi:hypothetical protein